MGKQAKRRCLRCGSLLSARSEIPQSSKRPSKVTALAELLRLTEQAGTAEISRDYFRANSRVGDKWNLYWPSFKAFLAAASKDDDPYYEALVAYVVDREEKAKT